MTKLNATEIKWEILNPVIEAAEQSVMSRQLPNGKESRWLRAISKAVAALSENPFIALREDGSLVWLSESGQTYTVNGACECKAAQENQPCKHLAARRLLENYEKALAFPEVVAPVVAPKVGGVSFNGMQPTDAPYKHRANGLGEKCGRFQI